MYKMFNLQFYTVISETGYLHDYSTKKSMFVQLPLSSMHIKDVRGALEKILL